VRRVIDSHAHLADAAFDDDRDGVLGRARAAGIEGIICIGETLSSASRARAIARDAGGTVWWTAGVHPHDALSFDALRDLAAIREHVGTGAVAVGECGLDYHYDHSPRDRQRLAFSEQIALAGELRCPVVVHTREAEEDTTAIVSDAGRLGVRGVMHCFTGSHALARTALDAGWLVSFAGIITFKRWTDDALLRLVPDDRLLVETDAPYLSPVPHRGKRNEPAHLGLTIARLAAARASTAERIASLTAANARELFRLREEVDEVVKVVKVVRLSRCKNIEDLDYLDYLPCTRIIAPVTR
jgi:TatD DNase family protein